MTKDPYKALKDVLNDAENQSSGGKGKERHATDNNFEDQVICTVQRLLYRHPFGGDAYQVIKKIIEAGRLYDTMGWEVAYAEVLGAIVYASAMAHLIKEYGQRECGENKEKEEKLTDNIDALLDDDINDMNEPSPLVPPRYFYEK